MSEVLLSVSNLNSTVRLGNGQLLTTVKDATFDLQSGLKYAVVGKSGSGKTSLISIIGLLNRNFEGSYFYGGIEVASLADRQLSSLRAKKMGFVFQNYSLIEHLRVWENVDLALHYSGCNLGRTERKEKVCRVLESVDILDKFSEFPNRLSGGEQQRVAIARALVSDPELLICDEPTGALDTSTSEQIMNLLQEMADTHGTTLLLVTHDEDLADTCDVKFRMFNGLVTLC